MRRPGDRTAPAWARRCTSVTDDDPGIRRTGETPIARRRGRARTWDTSAMSLGGLGGDSATVVAALRAVVA